MKCSRTGWLGWMSRVLLAGSVWGVFAATDHPIYQRQMPAPQDLKNFASDFVHIDLGSVSGPAYAPDPADLTQYNGRFDSRAAAAVAAAVDFGGGVYIYPPDCDPDGKCYEYRGLLEFKPYADAPDIWVVTAKCLAAMAFPDYFPGFQNNLRGLVSQALLLAAPGWCGTFGPGVDGSFDLLESGGITEGNYDMAQMFLIPIVYRYYDELTPEARDWAITVLLARGTIHRPNESDMFTSGGEPDDWTRAGYISPGGAHKNIDETENHIMTIQTARYLANQLMYPRDHNGVFDNRRNGNNGGPNCTDLMLALLRNMLRDDFSEYNAKNYQEETRWALLNLCTYAYDEEVRLAARMVLDYISAHIAVSSNDLRRFVPFRRRNEPPKISFLPSPQNTVMNMALLDDAGGADPMGTYYAMQTGQLRGYRSPNHKLAPPDKPYELRPWASAIASGGKEVLLEVLSDYRLPPSVHDLFVNDMHRRFYQRLHRTPRDEAGGNRNVNNMELFASSPSYLLSAGGEPGTYAIDPYFAGILLPNQGQQLGVAVSTTFIPTGASPGFAAQNAEDLIQFVSLPKFQPPALTTLLIRNYGVAPDFACGYGLYLPQWVRDAGVRVGPYLFVNKGSLGNGPNTEPAGFYLAIHEDGDLGFIEAFDTWLHPDVSFEQFQNGVLAANPTPSLKSNVESVYTTRAGARIRFVVWAEEGRIGGDVAQIGGEIRQIDYGTLDRAYAMGDAGNDASHFLNGTIMNSPREAVVEIMNPFLGTKIVLDLSDAKHPRRISEDGEVYQAGGNHEVWVDFAWTGLQEGDFYRPFNTLAAAAAAVANGGVIKIVPGTTREKFINHRSTNVRVETPIGQVQTGLSIFTQPKDAEGEPCGAAEFNVVAYGEGELHYQWRMDGVPLTEGGSFTGVHSSRLHVEPLLYDIARTFDVVISDDTGPENAVSTDPAQLELPFPPWVEVAMKPSPPEQQNTRGAWVSAYDEKRGVVVMYGGTDYRSYRANSLWEYDGETWKAVQDAFLGAVRTNGQQLFNNNDQPPSNYAMVYNPDDQLIYLLGESSWREPLRVWTWDGRTWKLPYNGPVGGGHLSYRAAYDRFHHRILLTRSVDSGYHTELLIYDPASNTMSEPKVMQPPLEPGVAQAFWVYDEFRKTGFWYQNDGVGFGPATMWAFTPDMEWVKLTNKPALPPWGQVDVVYDPIRRRTIALGAAAGYPWDTATRGFPREYHQTIPSAASWVMEQPDGPPRTTAGVGRSPTNTFLAETLVFDRRRRALVAPGFLGPNSVSGTPPFPAWTTYEARYLDRVQFDRPPRAGEVQIGGSVVLKANAAGFGTLEYAWRHNGIKVSNGSGGAAEGGGVISGASDGTLVITGVRTSDLGSYDVIVSNSCGTLASASIAVSLTANATIAPPTLVGKNLQIQFGAAAGGVVTLENASSVKGPWKKVANLNVSESGLVEFTDPLSNEHARFYRTVSPAY